VALAYLLDTSIYSQPLKLTPDPHVVSRWQALGDAPLAISIIADAEVRYGLALKGSAKLYAAYESLLRGRFPVFPVDQTVGEAFARMKAVQQQIGRPVPDLE
jgi:predicted nucleic acid-binding protein